MYNYFPNVPFWPNRFMPEQDFNIPMDMPYPYMDGYNPMNILPNPMNIPQNLMNMPPNPMNMPQNPMNILPNLMNVQQDPMYSKKYNTYPKTNKNMLNLNNEMRKLWEQHSFWTRLAIMAIASGSPDTQLVSQRLLRNPKDFEKALTNFYGPTAAKKFSDLLKEHLLIASDLVNAAKKKDNTNVNLLDAKWHKNADEIADTLSHINPYWSKEDLKNMLYEHLTLVKSEAVSILTNKYEDSISLFDKIENQALMMADTFTEGIQKQFPNKF